jgi:hypothetical protein
VGLGARLAGAQLALLSRLGPTGWATNGQVFPLGDLHRYIMQYCRATRCSLLTRVFARRPVFCGAIASSESSCIGQSLNGFREPTPLRSFTSFRKTETVMAGAENIMLRESVPTNMDQPSIVLARGGGAGRSYNGVSENPSRLEVEANMSKVRTFVVTLLLVACVCVLLGRASAGPIETSTTVLTVLPAGSVVAGTAVTLTATVTDNAKGSIFPVKQGMVVFCDANAAHCEDSAILGSAQLTGAGTATIKLTLGVGTYSINAAFQGKSAPPSASGPQSLTVEANASYLSFANIASSGIAGNYTLTGTIAAFGKNVPTGTVSFLDTDSGDVVVGTAALDPTSLGFTLLPSLKSPAPVGLQPQNTVLGDFNNDGILDLAATNSGGNSTNILLGNGDGTFGLQTAYAAGTSAFAIARGDFNGDGNLDLAVSNTAANTISVFLGVGDGTFLAQQTYAVGNGPQSIAVADFDGDGVLDLAVLDRNDRNVTVLLGLGDGTFQVEQQVCGIPPCAPRTFAVGVGGQVVATADFNGDGRADLVVSNAEDSRVSILLGLGDGTFQAQATYAVRFNPIGVAVADFNKDGIPDLVIANAESNNVSVLLGVGDGTFQLQVTYPTGRSPEGVSAGDFNGDGNMDLVVSNNNAATVSVLLGKGDGTFQPQVAFAVGTRPFGMGVGDLNGDGLPDVVVANTSVSSASILLSAQTETAIATGQAVFGTGNHEVLASYPGDTDRAASESDTVVLATIPQVVTATTLMAAPNPAFAGQPITLTATVVPAPTGATGGTVSFFNGATLLGTGTINSSGIATFTSSNLPTGPLSLTAAYSGNTSSAGSTSAIQIVTVNPQTVTTIALNATPNPASPGQAVILTATVVPAPTGVPAGTVSFFSGTTLLGTANLNSSGVAVLSTTGLSSGANTITAVYSGNVGFATSTSSALGVTEAVTTVTVLAAAPNPAITGMSVTLTASVTPAPAGTPAGTVSFFSGDTLLGIGSVNSSGVASFTASALAPGTYSLTAVYSGNAGSATSTSSSLSVSVGTTYSVSAPAAPFTLSAGGSVDINVTVPPVGGAFDSVVIMSASGLPAGFTASFNPATVTPGASGAVTVMTIHDNRQTAAIPAHSRSFPFAPISLAAGLCVMASQRKRLAKSMPMILLIATLAGGTLVLTGCNGGFAEPSQKFVITVTGSSGSQHVSTTVNLIVK